MNRKIRICVVLAMIVFTACAAINLNTPEKQYLAARAEFNLILEQYISIQSQVPDDQHKRIVQAFESAQVALDAWSDAVVAHKDPATNIQAWLKAKSLILKILREIDNG